MGKPKNIVNQRFGKLVATKWTGNKDHTGSYLWHCRCDCDNTHIVSTARLRHGAVKSCGCEQFSGLDQYRHGYTHKPLYYIWHSMRQRCNDPSCKAYKYYGARGIKVCKRWDDFTNFLADLGDRPHPDLSLDRIDNNGHYKPSNVRWSTRKEQRANRRPTKWGGWKHSLKTRKLLSKLALEREAKRRRQARMV